MDATFKEFGVVDLYDFDIKSFKLDRIQKTIYTTHNVRTYLMAGFEEVLVNIILNGSVVLEEIRYIKVSKRNNTFKILIDGVELGINIDNLLSDFYNTIGYDDYDEFALFKQIADKRIVEIKNNQIEFNDSYFCCFADDRFYE